MPLRRRRWKQAPSAKGTGVGAARRSVVGQRAGRRRPTAGRRSKAERAIRAIVNVELAVAIAAVAAAVGAGMLGFDAYVVETSSMAPAIPAGSLAVVDTRAGGASLRTGDVVAYRAGTTSAESAPVVVHRVVDVDSASEKIATKGDANGAADPAPVPYESVVGRCIASVPGIGSAAAGIARHRWAIAGAIVAANVALVAATASEGRRGGRARRARRRAEPSEARPLR